MTDTLVCHCGRPARGEAATGPETGAVWHYCRQCSVGHCELNNYLWTGILEGRITPPHLQAPPPRT